MNEAIAKKVADKKAAAAAAQAEAEAAKAAEEAPAEDAPAEALISLRFKRIKVEFLEKRSSALFFFHPLLVSSIQYIEFFSVLLVYGRK